MERYMHVAPMAMNKIIPEELEQPNYSYQVKLTVAK